MNLGSNDVINLCFINKFAVAYQIEKIAGRCSKYSDYRATLIDDWALIPTSDLNTAKTLLKQYWNDYYGCDYNGDFDCIPINDIRLYLEDVWPRPESEEYEHY